MSSLFLPIDLMLFYHILIIICYHIFIDVLYCSIDQSVESLYVVSKIPFPLLKQTKLLVVESKKLGNMNYSMFNFLVIKLQYTLWCMLGYAMSKF